MDIENADLAIRKRGFCNSSERKLQPLENFAKLDRVSPGRNPIRPEIVEPSPVKKRAKRIIIEDGSIDAYAFPKLSPSDRVVDVLVKSVETAEHGLKLVCKELASELPIVVRLEGIWSNTVISPSNHLRLISPTESFNKELVVNDDQGMAVVESDQLVPCTSVTQAVFCSRKAVISQRFRAGNQSNKAMLLGSIVHLLFQAAVQRKPRFLTRSWLLGLWKRELRDSYVNQLVALQISLEELEENLSPYLDSIVSWAHKFMPPPLGRNDHLPNGSRIKDVLDVEENMWDFLIGIKGKIDVSLQVETRNQKTAIEPLELKTGRSNLSAEHFAQVLLYCTSLSSRNHDLDAVGDGSLLYLIDGVMRNVHVKANELKGILNMRNELAATLCNLSEDSFPPPLSDTRLCSRCEHAVTCTALQRTSKKIDTDVCSILELFSQFTSHLSGSDLKYFKKWVRWIFLEWATDRSKKSGIGDVWKLTAEEREEKGSCISGLKVVEVNLKSSKPLVKFSKKSGQISLSRFSSGDMVVISSDLRQNFDIGFVSSINENSVEIRTDAGAAHFGLNMTFAIDRYESTASYQINLGNVSLLMQSNEHAQKIRSLVIDLRKPVFCKMPKEKLLKIAPLIKLLNREQGLAVLKSLMAEDYAVVEGLPGSGKTSTIVTLTRCLLALNRSVLITTYTHSAVDNVLLKLLQFVSPEQVLRLGSSASVKLELQKLTFESKLAEISDSELKYARAQSILKDTPIVACTCLEASSNVLFSHRRFSMTIVDEASLVLESALIPAIAYSDAFVLVGDSYQLAPLVQSKEAKQEGMAVSLLERLKQFGEATVSLQSQYRMNRPIATLSSNLFYNGKLVCANESVAESYLNTLSCENLDFQSLKDSVQLSISCLPQDAVIFIDTQSTRFPKFQLKHGADRGSCYNEGEIELAKELSRAFVQCGVTEENIGVISVYRYHVELLRAQIGGMIEVNTVDQYQGRDKSVIIVSLVWTNGDDSHKSELLSDHRRINVALTRAKHKLVLIGCRQSLISYPTVAALIDLIPDRNIVAIDDKL